MQISSVGGLFCVERVDQLVLIVDDSVIISNRLASMVASLFFALFAAALHENDCQKNNHETTTNSDENPLPIVETGLSFPWVITNSELLINTNIRIADNIIAQEDLSCLCDVT